ncbi:hypothetical protein N7527_007940 [Penicillium freii]|nr:hypothetical protein N7527_007940 [Penicillium freii]
MIGRFEPSTDPFSHVTSTSCSFSLIERVILSSGAMLISSVYFQFTICPEGRNIYTGFSLIERVILSAGAMLIFSVYFQLTICPEGRNIYMFSSL